MYTWRGKVRCLLKLQDHNRTVFSGMKWDLSAQQVGQLQENMQTGSCAGMPNTATAQTL